MQQIYSFLSSYKTWPNLSATEGWQKFKYPTLILWITLIRFSVVGLGELFTWGQGGPRLGYQSVKRKEILPRLVEGLQEHRVTEVACGLSHTLGKLYVARKILVILGVTTFWKMVGITFRYKAAWQYYLELCNCGDNNLWSLVDGVTVSPVVILGTLRSNDGDASGDVAEKQTLRPFKRFRPYRK